MIKAGIIGSTGYAGGELVRLLLGHKGVDLVWYGSQSYAGVKYQEVYRNMFQIVDAECIDEDLEQLADEVDIIFTAAPQGFLASRLSEAILSRTKVIDLSADFRIKDVLAYEKWYQLTHNSPQYIEEAAYGLCEINRETIKSARIVANPGCYPTCSELAIYPLLKEGLIDSRTIIIDAKSGTSGAGRGAKLDNLYCEVNENIRAYQVTSHRHIPEIEEQFSDAAGSPVKITFTPHLVPMNRGILVTAYASLAKDVTWDEVRAAYEYIYKKEQFIRLLDRGVCPETRWVRGSNYVDLSFEIDERTGRIVILGALDNLVKGAAGQAVQNMNILFNFPENEGLTMAPIYP